MQFSCMGGLKRIAFLHTHDLCRKLNQRFFDWQKLFETELVIKSLDDVFSPLYNLIESLQKVPFSLLTDGEG